MNLNMHKYILVVGSGYGVDKWLSNNIRFLKYFDIVIALNNAWYLLYKLGIQFRWYHSSDFYGCGHYIPPKYIELYTINFSRCNLLKNKYSGTVLVDCLNGLANAYYLEPVTICIIGCDMDYSTEKTHFYGDGSYIKHVQDLLKINEPSLVGKNADPLRYGKQFVIDQLIGIRTDAHWLKLVNLSSNPNTLLPFSQIDIKNIFKKRLMLKNT